MTNLIYYIKNKWFTQSLSDHFDEEYNVAQILAKVFFKSLIWNLPQKTKINIVLNTYKNSVLSFSF